MANFAAQLMYKLLECQFEEHKDNYDVFRFGNEAKPPVGKRLREFISSLMRKIGFFRQQYLFPETSRSNLKEWSAQLPGLEWMFQNLADDESRHLLVDLVAYRILGHRHVRLPLSGPTLHTQLQECVALTDGQDAIADRQDGFTLFRQSLIPLGYPISAYLPKTGPLTTFVLEQYAHGKSNTAAKPGNIVIDAGACWGDTALYFAHVAGSSGRVYSFEFKQENIEIFKRNLSLNPSLANRVELVARPLWSLSNVPMSGIGLGPGSKALPADADDKTAFSYSVSIDDFVKERSLPRVDFVKMDIEGAEYEALQGAREVLRSNKPDLALCVYHSPEDLFRLARYVNDLRLGYRFYLGHFTIHAEETVLFATTRSLLVR